MNRLTAKREFRFSIVILFFGIFLLVTTLFFPWISYQQDVNGQNVFHLNYEMMRDSTLPEIKSMADNLGLIIFMLWSTIVFGLLSILSITYHIATKKSDIGFYMSFLINLFIIVLAFLIVNRYFSVIDYINKVDIIYLSSPFPYFSYTFISLISSIVFLSISGIYGGFITIMILKDFKEMGIFSGRKNTINAIVQQIKDSQTNLDNNMSKNISGLYNITENGGGLSANHIGDHEENEINFLEKIEKKTSKPFSIGESDEDIKGDIKEDKDAESEKGEKREVKPFSFNDIEKKSEKKNFQDQITQTPPSSDQKGSSTKNTKDGQVNNCQSNPITESSKTDNLISDRELNISVNLESEKNDKIENKSDNKTVIKTEKKIKTVICPQCKQIFSVEKKGEATTIKCPHCGKEGNIG